jgi:hypothetical protein
MSLKMMVNLPTPQSQTLLSQCRRKKSSTRNLMVRPTVEAIIILSKVALNTVLDPSIDTPANSNWITTTTICKRFSTAHHVRK